MSPPDTCAFYDNVNKYQFDTTFELGNKLIDLAGQINLADFIFIKMLYEFDLREGWRLPGISSCSHWLCLHCGLRCSTAREKVRVTHALARLPMINDAFEAGTVSYSKVRALTRVATDENEAALLKVAVKHTASFMDDYVGRMQQVDDNQEPMLLEDDYEERRLHWYQDKNGAIIFKGKLPQMEGALFIKAIEEIMRQNESETGGNTVTQKAEPVITTQTKDVMASLNALINLSAQSDDESSKNAPAGAQTANETGLTNISHDSPLVKKPSFAQKRADAIAAMAEHFVATATVDEDKGIKALAGHERCQVVLHLNVDTLKHAHEHGDDYDCHHQQTPLTPPNLDLQWISMKNAKRFSSDASLLTVMENGYGDILNLGRKTRTVTPSLKKALDIRDETCRFPGCCAKRYFNFHHIKHWGNLGDTEAPNLVKLCRFHHMMLHRGHFSIELQPINSEQRWKFKTMMGKEIRVCPVLPNSPRGKSHFNYPQPSKNRRKV